MTDVISSKILNGGTRLWRYLSLDKLIDLLFTHELYFSPLASFIKSDPFEGYMPAVAIDAEACAPKTMIDDVELAYSLVQDYCTESGHNLTVEEQNEYRAKLDRVKLAPRLFWEATAKAIAVNCWHSNECESEAMWRFYADNGKAVAVETTLDALTSSIRLRESSHSVHIYPVKYVDFFDTKLTLRECIVEGHLAPLLKRISCEHEREVRAFIGRRPSVEQAAKLDYWKPAPVRLPIDAKTMIKAIHIFPYAEEPFPSSIKRMCEVLGLSPRIVHASKLLSGHEELLNGLIPPR